MLRSFQIENFHSIREAQSLNLELAANATDPDGRYATPIPGHPSRFPKVIAIFGANGSGKTTVLKALAMLVDFTRNSADWKPDAVIMAVPFLVKEWLQRPTRFRVEFDA